MAKYLEKKAESLEKLNCIEFCVTNALGLGADCLHEVPIFGFVNFLSENSLHLKFFFIAVHSQLLESFVLFQLFTASHSK